MRGSVVGLRSISTPAFRGLRNRMELLERIYDCMCAVGLASHLA